MARIRTIKPEFWTSSQVVRCPVGARLLFIGLWNFCDDAGRMKYDPFSLRMQVFPGDDFSVEQMEGWVRSLQEQGLVQVYTVDGQQYLEVTGFQKHQKIDARYPSRLPSPKAANGHQTPPIGEIPADSRALPPDPCPGMEWNTDDDDDDERRGPAAPELIERAKGLIRRMERFSARSPQMKSLVLRVASSIAVGKLPWELVGNAVRAIESGKAKCPAAYWQRVVEKWAHNHDRKLLVRPIVAELES